MKEYSLNKKFLFATIVLTAAVLLIAKVISMLLMGEVTVAEAANTELSLLLAGIFFVASLSYIYSIVVMIRQYVVHGSNAFTITGEGIQNTFIGINVLAFIFVAGIKEIPWDAVRYVEKKDGYYTAKVDTEKVQAGVIAKLILKLTGYRFCSNFISEDIGKEKLVLAKMAENK